MKPKIIQLVDSLEYVHSNCFQHQLLDALRSKADVTQVTVAELHNSKVPANTSHVVSCLKMRTVHRSIGALNSYLSNCPLVMYEQDPWHGYMDGSPYNGIFALIGQQLNLSFVAVTTRWWAEYMEAHSVSARFVKMWMLPQYCDRGPPLIDRHIELGFIGSMHPHRRKLIDLLDDAGMPVNASGGYDYRGYLNALHRIKVYVHSEDCPFTIAGAPHNLNDGLWAREIEVGARGCISIRNWGVEHSSYVNDQVKNTFLYQRPEDVPGIIKTISQMDPIELQERINSTVEYIRDSDEWSRTAEILIRG